MWRADRLFRIVQRLRRRGATTARQLAEALECRSGPSIATWPPKSGPRPPRAA